MKFFFVTAICIVLNMFSHSASASDMYLYPFTPFGKASSYIDSNSNMQLDSSGIPFYSYKGHMNKAGDQYNPGFIADYAQAFFRDAMESGNKEEQQKFLKLAEWLLHHAVQRQYGKTSYLVWIYDFENPKFLAGRKWISGFTAGKILPVFLYAYHITARKEFEDAARKTLNSFLVSMEHGGLSTFVSQISTWFEEVAQAGIPSAKILNGHIYALAGIYTYWKNTENQKALEIFQKGIRAVKEDIAKYDAGFISYYSQYPVSPRILAPVNGYNTLHVHQLLWLYSLDSDPIWLEFALKFARYDDSFVEYNASSSIDPKDHGPGNLKMLLGNKYWSASAFPASVTTSMPNARSILGGTILLPTSSQNRPLNTQFSIINKDGVRQNIETKKEIVDQRLNFIFKSPVTTRKLVFTFDSALSKVLALRGISLDFQTPWPAAVCDFDSFRSGNKPATIFRNGWTIKGSGFLLLDYGKTFTPHLLVSHSLECLISCRAGNKPDELAPVTFIKKDNNKITLSESARYVRIEYEKCVPQVIHSDY